MNDPLDDPLDDPISDYLSGLMDERETAEFERRMESDPALRLEVEAGRATLKRLAGYLEQTCPGIERADALEAAALFSTVRHEQEADGVPVGENGEVRFQKTPLLPQARVVPVAPPRRGRFGRFLAQGFAAAAIFAAGIVVGTRMPVPDETGPAVSREDTPPLPQAGSLPEVGPPPTQAQTPVQAPVPVPAPSPAPARVAPDGERVLPVAEPVRVAQRPDESGYSAALQSPPIRVTRREGARTIVESASSRAAVPALWVVDGSFQLVPSGTEKTQPEVRERK
jgi:hypothetical protein